jgi:hypothetical protein
VAVLDRPQADKGLRAAPSGSGRRLGGWLLLVWREHVASGCGLGEDLILNRSYQTVATARAGEGYQADMHEFQRTPH